MIILSFLLTRPVQSALWLTHLLSRAPGTTGPMLLRMRYTAFLTKQGRRK